MAGGQALGPPATFTHTNPLNIYEISTTKFQCHRPQIWQFYLFFFLLFSFLVFTKSQVLNLRMGR